jgi:hypothetical protein
MESMHIGGEDRNEKNPKNANQIHKLRKNSKAKNNRKLLTKILKSCDTKRKKHRPKKCILTLLSV